MQRKSLGGFSRWFRTPRNLPNGIVLFATSVVAGPAAVLGAAAGRTAAPSGVEDIATSPAIEATAAAAVRRTNRQERASISGPSTKLPAMTWWRQRAVIELPGAFPSNPCTRLEGRSPSHASAATRAAVRTPAREAVEISPTAVPRPFPENHLLASSITPGHAPACWAQGESTAQHNAQPRCTVVASALDRTACPSKHTASRPASQGS